MSGLDKLTCNDIVVSRARAQRKWQSDCQSDPILCHHKILSLSLSCSAHSRFHAGINARRNGHHSCVHHNMLHPSGLEAITHDPLQHNTAHWQTHMPVITPESDLPDIGLTTSSVFTIRSSISIDAPKQKVWDVLLDFSSYREWCVNPYFMMAIDY